MYAYKVQILEEQHEKSHEKGMAALKDKVKWSGSFMDVQCSIMRFVALVNMNKTDHVLL